MADDIYPEHEKLHAVNEDSQKIGEFMNWLGENGYTICEYNNDEEEYFPVMGGRMPNMILSKYFDIDEDKIENEKLAMLEELRAAQKERDA